MSFYLSNVIFDNRAPFEHLELDLKNEQIVVLNAINGGGKTTLLTHIVDAFYEMAKKSFYNEFEKTSTKYYRISSGVYNLNREMPSIVYLRFVADRKNVDYVDISGKITKEEYDSIIKLDDKIEYSEISGQLEKDGNIKHVSAKYDKSAIKILFENNILTYFPSYRFEMPAYLNEIYQEKAKMDFVQRFNGFLANPIEVVKDIKEIAGWILDILLDMYNYSGERNREFNQNSQVLWQKINRILNGALFSNELEEGEHLRFGVGKRDSGDTRICIMKDKKGESDIFYPSLFNMSTGELSILSIFVEILRQADKIYGPSTLKQIKGIVLIDEIDKHLHINLQENVLHLLFKLFPNIQFIVSSHSPFVSIGLQEHEETKGRTEIIDLDKGGIRTGAREIDEYKVLYDTIKSYNENYKFLMKTIDECEQEGGAFLITEGNNAAHIKQAISVLCPELYECIKIVEGVSANSGCDQLKELFKTYPKQTNSKFLFVWDCDVAGIDKIKSVNKNFYKFCFNRNDKNDIILNGVENLYSKSLFKKAYLDREIVKYDRNGKIINREYKPKKKEIVQLIQTQKSKTTFKNFKPLMEMIKVVTDKRSG